MKLFISIVAFATLCIGTSKAASIKCGGSGKSKNIELTNPSLPPRECEYTINAYSSNVCQLRIDWAMTLAQPTLPSAENGLTVPECLNDYLQIGDLKLCGVETSQHIYVPFNRTAGVKSLTIKIVSAVRTGGSQLPTLYWDMDVTQLECPSGSAVRRSADDRLFGSSIKDGFMVAPVGCDQYFSQETGTIQSFNYNNGKGIFPYNLNYAICFRRTTSTVGLIIKGTDFNLNTVGLSDDLSLFGQIDNSCVPSVHTAGRSENYLMIPQATILGEDVRASYFCGHSVEGHTVLSTNPGPLSMIFNSDGFYQEGVTAEGFSLEYEVLSN